VNIVTLAEGDVTHLHVGLKGTMNALFLKDLADKTRRGLRGRVELGKSGGGLCYGYKVNPHIARGRSCDRRSRNRSGRSGMIRRIFRDYAADLSPKAIAKRLNVERCPGLAALRGIQAPFTAILPAAPESCTTSSTSGGSCGIAFDM
jgi:site-specific DNA recombinase